MLLDKQIVWLYVKEIKKKNASKISLDKILGPCYTKNSKGGKWVSFVSSILAVGLAFTGFIMRKSTRCGWLIVKK
jgi:hypothetical protein